MVESLISNQIVGSSILLTRLRGISSSGRALVWQTRGEEFDSPMLQKGRRKKVTKEMKKVIDKAFDTLMNMSDEEFWKEFEKHKNSDMTRILIEAMEGGGVSNGR